MAVELAPLSRIVGVGWGTITHVAYSFSLSWHDTSGFESGCTIGGAYPAAPVPAWGTYKTGDVFAYAGAGSTSIRKGGTWLSGTGHTIAIGRPSLLSPSYGSWLYVHGAGSDGGYYVNGGLPRLFAPTGAAIDVAGPSGQSFIDAALLSGDIFGDAFTGSANCYSGTSGNKEAPCTGTTTIGDTSGFTSYGAFSILRSGFSATVDGKAFHAIGMALSGGTSFAGAVRENATISVLMARTT